MRTSPRKKAGSTEDEVSVEATLKALMGEIETKRADLPFQTRLQASVERNHEILARLASASDPAQNKATLAMTDL